MQFSVGGTEWKPEASVGKRSQGEMPFVGEVQGPQMLDRAVIEQATFNGCLSEAARHCGMEDQEIADAIHISHGYMSRFMRGVAQQWAKRFIAYMRYTRSLAPLQKIADELGCDVVLRNSVAAELAAAKARVAELERGRRAAA